MSVNHHSCNNQKMTHSNQKIYFAAGSTNTNTSRSKRTPSDIRYSAGIELPQLRRMLCRSTIIRYGAVPRRGGTHDCV